MPLYNPWKTNLGKFIVPNVFVSVKLLETLVKNYNSVGRYIQAPNGDAFIRFYVGTLNEVFNLDPNPNKLLSFRELEEEYLRMNTTYTVWKLAIHKKEVVILTK